MQDWFRRLWLKAQIARQRVLIDDMTEMKKAAEWKTHELAREIAFANIDLLDLEARLGSITPERRK